VRVESPSQRTWAAAACAPEASSRIVAFSRWQVEGDRKQPSSVVLVGGDARVVAVTMQVVGWESVAFTSAIPSAPVSVGTANTDSGASRAGGASSKACAARAEAARPPGRSWR
jgi:hypothetical protein